MSEDFEIIKTYRHKLCTDIVITKAKQQSLFEMLIDTQLVKKFAGSQGIGKFSTVFIKASHWSLF
jgi:hypothetical protein